MAINPEAQFAGKINPSDADYPFGSARNITVPGDGTGTPFVAALVNDTFGFQQAMLAYGGGVVPSGTPETSLASQYMQSLIAGNDQRHGTLFATVATMVASTGIKAGQIVSTAGYYDGWAASAQPLGWGRYNAATLAQVRSARSDGAWIPDELINFTAANGIILMLDWDGRIDIKQSGGRNDDSTDNLANFDAIAAEGANVWLSDGIYRTSGTTVFSLAGQGVFGSGQEKSAVRGTHTTGAIFRFKEQYHKCRGFSVLGDTARAAAAFTSNGFGLHFETEDVADDPNVTRMRSIHVADVEVSGQTGAGIYVVGPVSDGSSIDRLRILNNSGHAIAIDRGFLSGRVNKAIFPTGVLSINNCLGFGNTGHAVAAGHKDDTLTTQTVRVVINNFDANISSMVSAQLYDINNDHGFWLAGSNNEINASTASGDGTQVGAFVKGTGTKIRNFRQVETAATLEIGDNVAGLPTKDILLDGVTVANTVAQTAAVILSNATDISNIRINIGNLSDITAIVDDFDVPGLSINDNTRQLIKSADQVVNNSTSLVDVTDLRYFLGVNEKVAFTATVFYSGDVTADIRLSVGGPAGVADVKFTVPSNLKVGSGGSVDTVNAQTAFGGLIVLGTDPAPRCQVIEGYIENGATAGNFSVRFAQLAAVVADTTVHKGSSLFITRTT